MKTIIGAHSATEALLDLTEDPGWGAHLTAAEKKAARPYQCPVCFLWHITTAPRPAKTPAKATAL